MGQTGLKLRLGIAVATAGSLLAATPAQASITIGQLADPGISECSPGLGDIVAVSGASPTTYTVPAKGTIVSWTMFASATANQQVKVKVFRKIGEPATYEVVGHAEPRTLTPGGTLGNTFPANIPVAPGDLLGIRPLTLTNCAFLQAGASIAFRNGDLPDGDSDSFTPVMDNALDLEATLVPDNDFSVAGTQRNRKRGTATLNVTVPNPGELTGSGNGVVAASAAAVISKSVGAGAAQLLISARGKKKKRLNEKGKVKLTVAVTYAPTNGDPSTQSVKVKLKKKLKHG